MAAVQSSFYSDIEVANADSEFYNAGTAGYFYSGSAKANHDVIIIGWDDNYPKENFHTPPKNDGAFICQNSWDSRLAMTVVFTYPMRIRISA